MFRLNSRHGIGFKIAFGQLRGMTVADTVFKQVQFPMHFRVRTYHRYIIHDFSKAKNSLILQVGFHLPGSNCTSVVVYGRCRYTRWHHDIDIRLAIFRLLQNVVDARKSGYICRFVRVRDKCGRAAPRGRCHKLCRGE